MKKIISFMIIAIFIAGAVCAQDKPRENRQREINSVSIEGTLKLENGFVAVQSGDTVYSVPLLNRYIGFISGLREGARGSVEGNAFRNFITPKKVIIDGKTYDFFANIPARNNLEPGKQAPERRNLAPVPGNMPGRNMAPRNMFHGRNMVPPGWKMGPMHKNFQPGQKPNPRG
jgi:hypothetical protein